MSSLFLYLNAPYIVYLRHTTYTYGGGMVIQTAEEISLKRLKALKEYLRFRNDHKFRGKQIRTPVALTTLENGVLMG